MSDNVNHPDHYTWKSVECFKVLEVMIQGLASYAACLMWNIIKYLYRYPKKNGVEDLKKARYYLDELIRWESEHLDKKV